LRDEVYVKITLALDDLSKPVSTMRFQVLSRKN